MNILDIAIAKKLAGGGGGSGTDNYNDLSNLPKINDTTLSGNKSSSALGLQSEINSDSKLASDLVDDTNQDNKFVTSTEKNTWNAKQNAIDSDHKLSSDLVDDANKTNKFVTSTEKNTWNAKQNAIDSDHKLSSSLVSYTEAEAAALASGIDSSKVDQISTNQTNILSVEDMVCATEFSSSTAYAVGDMVTYEHKLYKFINAHQGAWSASDVQNYDLTRLEAEDRASLAEVVDSGAKNLLQLPPISSWTIQSSITATVSGNVVTATRTSTSSTAAIEIPLSTYIPTNTMIIISGCPSGGGNDTYLVDAFDNGNYITGSGDAGSGSEPIKFTTNTQRIRIRFAANTSYTNLKFSLMICTKAAFGVSSKFVPYRPNYDLVSYLANAGGFHDASHGSFVQNADLNAISESCVRLYHSPSNNPTTATYVLVKTYMLDSTTGMQEATAFASPVKSYTRVKMASTWGSWVETTNAT